MSEGYFKELRSVLFQVHCKYIIASDINISIFFRYTANSFFHSGRNAAEERFENKSQFSPLPMVMVI